MSNNPKSTIISRSEWWLRPASHRTLLVFSETLIYLSYTAVVPPRGFAPRSSAYRADALLLSYGGLGKWSRAPVPPRASPRPKRGGLRSSSRAILRRVAGASRARPSRRRLAPWHSNPGETSGQRTGARRSSYLDENGCGGRIRTGDTRRMKPLPYHLATPLLFERNGATSRTCTGIP